MGGRWSVWSSRTRNAERETRGMDSAGGLPTNFASRKTKKMEEKKSERWRKQWRNEGIRVKMGKVFGVELARGWGSRIELWAEGKCWVVGGRERVEIKEGGVSYVSGGGEATPG